MKNRNSRKARALPTMDPPDSVSRWSRLTPRPTTGTDSYRRRRALTRCLNESSRDRSLTGTSIARASAGRRRPR